MSITHFVEDTFDVKRPSPAYFEYINYFEKNKGNVELYFLSVQEKFTLSQMDNLKWGSNDNIDLAHLLYLDKDDIIVSDDKIFEKLKRVNVIKIVDFKKSFQLVLDN